MCPAVAGLRVGAIHHTLLDRAADRRRQLIFRMDVQRDLRLRIDAHQTDLRVPSPQQP